MRLHELTISTHYLALSSLSLWVLLLLFLVTFAGFHPFLTLECWDVPRGSLIEPLPHAASPLSTLYNRKADTLKYSVTIFSPGWSLDFQFGTPNRLREMTIWMTSGRLSQT